MTYQHTLAKIHSTHLGYEDHGIFSLNVGFDYGGSRQGFGPMFMQEGLIEAVIKAAGVDSWEKLSGRTVYAVRDNGHNGLVRGMAPLPTERGSGFVLKSDGTIQPYEVPRD